MEIAVIIIACVLLLVLTAKISVEHETMKRRFIHEVRRRGKISNAKEFREWVDTLSIAQLKDEMKKMREHHFSSDLRKFLLTQTCHI